MTWCHQIDLTKSKLNTVLYIFCCTGRQKCTKLHRFAPILSFPGWYPRPEMELGQDFWPVTRPDPSRPKSLTRWPGSIGTWNNYGKLPVKLESLTRHKQGRGNGHKACMSGPADIGSPEHQPLYNFFFYSFKSIFFSIFIGQSGSYRYTAHHAPGHETSSTDASACTVILPAYVIPPWPWTLDVLAQNLIHSSLSHNASLT